MKTQADANSRYNLEAKKTVFGIGSDNSTRPLRNYPSCELKDLNDINEAINWCQKNFNDNWIWSGCDSLNFIKFWFLYNEDILIFKIRYACE